MSREGSIPGPRHSPDTGHARLKPAERDRSQKPEAETQAQGELQGDTQTRRTRDPGPQEPGGRQRGAPGARGHHPRPRPSLLLSAHKWPRQLAGDTRPPAGPTRAGSKQPGRGGPGGGGGARGVSALPRGRPERGSTECRGRQRPGETRETQSRTRWGRAAGGRRTDSWRPAGGARTEPRHPARTRETPRPRRGAGGSAENRGITKAGAHALRKRKRGAGRTENRASERAGEMAGRARDVGRIGREGLAPPPRRVGGPPGAGIRAARPFSGSRLRRCGAGGGGRGVESRRTRGRGGRRWEEFGNPDLHPEP